MAFLDTFSLFIYQVWVYITFWLFILILENEIIGTGQKYQPIKESEASTNLNNLSGLVWLLSYS